jgi:hypothetical protein
MVVKSPTEHNDSVLLKPPTSAETIVKIYKEEGVSGFFKGLFPALILVSNPTIVI